MSTAMKKLTRTEAQKAMDEGKVLVDNEGRKAWKDDNHPNGPYVVSSIYGGDIEKMVGAWNLYWYLEVEEHTDIEDLDTNGWIDFRKLPPKMEIDNFGFSKRDIIIATITGNVLLTHTDSVLLPYGDYYDCVTHWMYLPIHPRRSRHA